MKQLIRFIEKYVFLDSDTIQDEYLQAYEDTVLIGFTKSNSEKLALFPQMVIFTNTLNVNFLSHLCIKNKYEI